MLIEDVDSVNTNVSPNIVVNNDGQGTLSPKRSGNKIIVIAAFLIGLVVLATAITYMVKQWSVKTGGNKNISAPTSQDMARDINLTTALLATIPDEYINNHYDIRGDFLDYGNKVFWYAYSQVPSETPHIVILNGDMNSKTEHYNILSGDLTKPLVYQKKINGNAYSLSIDGKDYPLDNKSFHRVLTAQTGNNYATAYIKESLDKMSQVVINGMPGKEYRAISGLTMSLDGRHVAYAASSGDFPLGQITLVVNGQEKLTNYNFIVLPTFSPDGNSLAYFAVSGIKASDKDLNNAKCVTVVDGRESSIECSELLFLLMGSEAESTSNHPYILFSPDSKQVAFMVYVGGRAYASDPEGSYILLNGKKGKQYTGVGPMSFSPDNKSFVYLAFTDDKKPILVVNGEEIKADFPMNAEKIIWSPDSKKFAYTSNREYVSVYDMDTKKLETKKLTPYSSDLQFSPDGKQLLFIRETLVPHNSPGSFTVKTDVVDAYSEVVIVENGRSVIFSNDGKHFAALASASAGNTISTHIVVDGKKGLSYDEIWTEPKFSLDGKFVGYGVKKGNELWWIVDPVN